MMRDYSRLFDLAGGEMQRRRQLFSGMPMPDMFGGAQHQQAVAEQGQEPGIAESLIGAAGTVGTAYANRPKPADPVGPLVHSGGKNADIANLPGVATMPEAGKAPEMSASAPWWKRLGGGLKFGGGRAYGGPMYPGYRYRVGDEEVLMLPGGGAQVIPGDDPSETARKERGLPPTRYDEIPASAPNPGMSGGRPATPSFNPNGPDINNPYGHMPPWNRDHAPRLGPGLRSVTEAPDPMMEPSPYDGRARTSLPDNASPRERALAEIQDLQRAGPQRTSSLWRRVGQGILGGLAEWAAAGSPGGIGGALGAVGAGATIYGASKGTAAEMKHRQKLAALFGKYKEAVAPEMAEFERAQAAAKAQGEMLNVEGKAISNTNARNDFLMKQLTAMGHTPEDVAAYLRGQNIPAIAMDARKFEDMWDAQGMPMSRPDRGDATWRPNPSAGVRPDKKVVPITVTSPDGGAVTGHQESGKAVDTAARIAKDAQDAAARQEERVYQRKKDMTDQQWREHVFNIEQQNTALDREIRKAAQGNKGSVAPEIEEVLGKANALRATADELRRAMASPPPPGKNPDEYYDDIRMEMLKVTEQLHELTGKMNGLRRKAEGRSDPLQILP